MNNNHYLYLCPDIKQSDDIYLSGDDSYALGTISYIQFTVTRCDNQTQECVSEEDYQSFISDLTIYSEVIQF